MIRVTLSLLTLPALLWASVAVGAWLSGHGSASASIIDGAMLLAWFALFTYFAMGAVAVPLLLLCAWRRWVTVWHAAAVGAVTGFLPLGVPMLSQLLDERLHLRYRLEQLASTYELVLLGVAGGVLFWFMAIWRNPQFSVGSSAGTRTPSTSSAA